MTREEILDLLAELGRRLAAAALRGEIFLVGGAAIAVAYSTRRSTADLDAIFEPKDVIYSIALQLAEERSLPVNWLNDSVKGFLPGADPNARVLLDHEGLRVTVASPRYLLAMKLFASRVERDEDDLRVLLALCGISSVDEALRLVEGFYGNRPVEPRVRYLVESLLDSEP